MLRPGYVVLLVGTVMVAGIWQSSALEHPAAVADKFDTLLQAGLSLFKSSDESAPAHTVRTQVSTVTLPADASEQGGALPAKAAHIERVAVANTTESRALEPATLPVGAIEAALNTPGPVEAAALPTPVVPAVRPPSNTPDTKTVSPRTPRPSTQVSAPPRKDIAATEKPTERKPQVARSKEPDPDAQLLEALLVHLRKTESAKGGGH